jgi:AcrR family transcriptional regulator
MFSFAKGDLTGRHAPLALIQFVGQGPHTMSSRTSLTREDWIHAAQHVLVKSGVDAVRVDTLAKELKITRGSFYYHFKSRSELLEGILSNWRARATEDVIHHLRSAHTSPQQQLQRLLELPSHGQTAREAAAIELGIRAWARRDKQARQAIDEIDSHRLNYIEGLLIQAGVQESEAHDRAYLIYAFQISLSLLHSEDTPQQRMERNVRMSHILIPERQAIPA